MKRFLLLVVSFLSFAASAWGSPLSIDVTASSCEIQGSDTIRVRYISIPSMSITAWADFKWDSNSLMFVPVNANYDQFPFRATNQYYPETATLSSVCQNEFGNNWAMADWSDISTYYSSSNDLTTFFLK